MDTEERDVQPLRFDRRGAVALLTLNRPEVRNALGGESMFSAFEQAVDRLNADLSLRCAVLTGAGSAFCAGGDLAEMRDRRGSFAGNPQEIARHYRHGIQRVPRALQRLEVPLIAAVNGPAIGAGNDLACYCDIRIASASARFAESFVKVGILPGDGGCWILPRVIGTSKAAELALTGDTLDAQEALRIGLVSQVVPDDRLLDEAFALAQRIAANPPEVLRWTKRLLWQGRTSTLDQAMDEAARLQGLAHHTADHAEAIGAFFEKRPPVFGIHLRTVAMSPETADGIGSEVLQESRPSPGVALLRLHRPAVLNALNLELRRALAAAFTRLDDDDEVAVIVMAGSERAFCAGADLTEYEQATPLDIIGRDMDRLWGAIAQCRKPVIAAVRGHALGGGCELAMLADILIAGEGARFGQPEVRIGLMPGGGATQRLTRRVGPALAMRLLLIGEPMTGAQAAAHGLVAELQPDTEVEPRALAMAQRLSSGPRLAQRFIKQAVLAAQNLPLEQGLEFERKSFQLLFATEDKREGIAAQLGKRVARFLGR